MPVAIPDQATYPGCDYYEIEIGQFPEKLHTDLPPTMLRGYRQTNTTDATVSQFHYLGPMIIADRDRPVRVKFTNSLPTGAGGNLFIPVDKTIMGAGMGPYMHMPPVGGMYYTENRATVHLHGNNSVWISDGTPHQWVTPAGEVTSYPKGVSVVNVPDMPAPGDGSMTFYYTNAHSARLMFYHDHSYGITRLNVYAGEAAGYLLTDNVEKDLINGTNTTGVNPGLASILPDAGIPLIIQDKTFVDAATIGEQDPTWNWGTTPPVPNTGDLWYPHVYMPAQNPFDPSGANTYGRWHYAAWFWPPATNLPHGPVPNPYYNAACDPAVMWCEPPEMPGTPNPSAPGEAFMDTPLVNGTLYPYMDVEPRVYRFRVLNAADDRFFNLQFYVTDPAVVTADGRSNTEVKMVPAGPTVGFPADWPTDGREGGVPDPVTRGPAFIQIGTEGGFLPAPVVVVNQPVTWNMNATSFNFGNVDKHALLLGTAERADVLVDFSAYAGKTIILYNDAPAAFPALDSRNDYYTGNPDQTSTGGAPSTQAGYGPNIRTVMQFRVSGTPSATATPDYYSPAYLSTLNTAFAKTATKRGVFEVSQDPVIIPSAAYNSAYNMTFPADTFIRQQQYAHTFRTVLGTTATVALEPKALQDEMGEVFDEYGRMMVMLGLELPFTAAGNQNFVMYGYAAPPVEIVKDSVYGTPIGSLNDGTQIWKITHNGVDTHTIHVHLFNAQLINRVAWDGAILPPDANELGWKETFRVNPLEHTIIAFRAFKPVVPFEVPNSVRMIDPTMPAGATLMGGPGGFFDPQGNPVTITNHQVNYGWEYVYHCHLLAHEEMDMMHAVILALAPASPSNLTATRQGSRVVLNWADNSINETGFVVQRATNAAFTTGLVTFNVGANVRTYTDSTTKNKVTYYYRVFAVNTVGDTVTPNFPTKSANSAFSNTVLFTR
jgi:FtsP/CotA-like multicopper oxidase with cupredoxin domain